MSTSIVRSLHNSAIYYQQTTVRRVRTTGPHTLLAYHAAECCESTHPLIVSNAMALLLLTCKNKEIFQLPKLIHLKQSIQLIEYCISYSIAFV